MTAIMTLKSSDIMPTVTQSKLVFHCNCDERLIEGEGGRSGNRLVVCLEGDRCMGGRDVRKGETALFLSTVVPLKSQVVPQ